ncbi:SusC/RagA family TonB-linked outer membrane protein [Flagellimonas myxillae]|uniref:SusC/RagA family TonB-linked outer membrane protein n=1 Tax=Flagellimonas myxillae TaxID=2942214 RepID=UPI00201EF47A|nr:TonB-dependent receptor [Muricauda myxillae]MCL6265422.1 TonB-dependent receptor [Muricauda myxillae]
MKLTTAFLFLCLFQINASTYSQNARITLDVENTTIESVLFDNIEKETDFKFFYENSTIDLNQKVTVKVNKARIHTLLNLLLRNTGIQYDILDKQIILTRKGNMQISKMVTPTLTPKEKPKVQSTVEGTILDQNGQPLPGASVVEKGTSNGTQSDFDGKFSLRLLNDDATLLISYIGFTTQEIQVNGQSLLNITLLEDTSNLEEVVVVGYGTQKITSLTSAVSSVDVEELGNVTTQNIAAALQGRTPGLFIRDSGYNQNLSFFVRGATTIGNNSPLFIVDGVPQDLLTVDPNDIEAISVLKDGAASAIYGSRAAAGVIIVTTKTGKNQKASFNFESFISFGELTTVQEAANSLQSARIMNEASINSGGDPLFSPEDISLFETGNDPSYPNTDWKKEFLKTEITNRYFLSASAGNERSSYYFSLGYRNSDGIVQSGIDRKQFNLRTNLKTKLRDNIDFDVNLNYVLQNNTAPNVNGGIDNIYLHMNSTAPFLPVRNEDGNFQFFNEAGSYGRGFWNVMWELEAGTANTKQKTFTANTNLTWELIEGLKFIGRYSLISSTTKGVSSIYKRSTTGGPPWFADVNSLSQTWRDDNQYNAQTFLSYDKSIGKHTLGVLAGWDIQFNEDSGLGASRRNFQFDNLLTEFSAPNSGDNDDITGLGSNTVENVLQSAVGRINYNYDEKYLVELAGRYDGASIFAPENRYGFFPSASFGWVINKENFFNMESVDLLKLRASYGVSGNNRVNGSYFSNIAFGTYVFGANGEIVVPTSAEGGIPFRDLKWETTSTTNVGVDFSLKSGLFSGSLDYYVKNTDDILLPSPVPGTVGTGRGGPAINAGSVKNSGFELVLNHSNTLANDFSYGISVNGTYNTNEITELTDSFSEFDTSYRVGDALGTVYGYIADGILSSQAEVDAYNAAITSGISPNTTMGDIRYVDVNGDGALNFEDNVAIAETIPKITYGVNLNAEWKNFDLQLFFQGTGKSKEHKSNDLFGNFSWIPEEANDAWSDSNPDGTYPRLLLFAQQTYFQNFYQRSSFWTFNSNYLRLKNLQLGYTLPIGDNKYINKARIYFAGTNVFTVSDFRPGFDPESNGLVIPPLKTFSLGVNINF